MYSKSWQATSLFWSKITKAFAAAVLVASSAIGSSTLFAYEKIAERWQLSDERNHASNVNASGARSVPGRKHYYKRRMGFFLSSTTMVKIDIFQQSLEGIKTNFYRQV
jgi:hypothetical protein